MFSNHLHLSEFQFERWMKFSVFSALMALVFVLIPFVEETFELKYVLFSRTKSVGNISLFKTIWGNSVIYSLQGDFFSPYTFLFKQNWNSIRIFFFSKRVAFSEMKISQSVQNHAELLHWIGALYNFQIIVLYKITQSIRCTSTIEIGFLFKICFLYKKQNKNEKRKREQP